MNIGGNTVTLFERVFGGNDYNYERTVAAVNEAMRSADNDAASTMQKLTGGMGLPF